MIRPGGAFLSSLLLLVASACGGAEDVVATPSPPTPAAGIAKVAPTPFPTPTSAPEPTPAPTPMPSPTAAPAPSPTAEPPPTSTPAPYDSNAAMFAIFSGLSLGSPQMFAALDQIAANKDASLVPVLVEILRFMPSYQSAESVAETLRTVTGQTFGTREWDVWMEWLGHSLGDYQPPSQYPAWKASLYRAIDSRFFVFLTPASEYSRIDLTEVVWGGVIPDGIPDLRNPTTLSPDEADYLLPTDRVFGVTINGESRAYPLRIINAHEMANDVLGGEPISLMW